MPGYIALPLFGGWALIWAGTRIAGVARPAMWTSSHLRVCRANLPMSRSNSFVAVTPGQCESSPVAEEAVLLQSKRLPVRNEQAKRAQQAVPCALT